MNSATQTVASASSWNRPIRVCPNEWCQCPHREAGADDRCRECRIRPANVEIHGASLTRLNGDCWGGEFGCCFSAWLAPEDCARSKADRLAIEAVVKVLSRDELIAWLRSTGVEAYEEETTKILRFRADIRQIALWWPRKFVTTAAR